MKKAENSKIKIILAEDQELVRKALISLIRENSNIEVIAEAENGKKLLELLKQVEPDIVLLDIEMPVMNGQEALDVISKRFPDVKVIILSMYEEMTLMSDFITKGARAYLPKGCSIERLFEAIETVNAKGYFFDDAVSKAMLSNLLNEKNINPLFDELALSEREIEVLKKLCDGKTNKEIANHLKISASTVDFHRGNIYRKTKSANITDLMKYSIKNGFVKVG